MCPIGQAIRLNNEAARLVRSGKLLDGACMLQEATDILRASRYCFEFCKTSLSLVLPHVPLTVPFVCPSSNRVDKACGYNGYNREGTMYVHDRLIFLSTDLICTSQKHHGQIASIVTLYITFNLAIVYHLCGRVLDHVDGVSTQAMTLYQTVLDASQNSKGEEMALLQCLVMNNLADLFDRFCNHQCSQHYLDCMAALACQTNCLYNTDVLDDLEVHFITLNQVLSQFSKAAQAA